MVPETDSSQLAPTSALVAIDKDAKNISMNGEYDVLSVHVSLVWKEGTDTTGDIPQIKTRLSPARIDRALPISAGDVAPNSRVAILGDTLMGK